MPNSCRGPNGKFCKKRGRSQGSGTSSTDQMSDSQSGVAHPNEAQMEAAAAQDDAELQQMMEDDPGQPSGAHQGAPAPVPPSPVLCGAAAAAADENSAVSSAAPSENQVRQMAANGTGQRTPMQMLQEMAQPLNQEQRAVGLSQDAQAPQGGARPAMLRGMRLRANPALDAEIQRVNAAMDAEAQAAEAQDAAEAQAAEDEAAYIAAEAVVVADEAAAALNAACDAANERAWEEAEAMAQSGAQAAGEAYVDAAAGPPQAARAGGHPESGAMPALVRTDTAGPSKPAVQVLLDGPGDGFNTHKQYHSVGVQPKIANLILIKLPQPHAYRNQCGLRIGMLESLEGRLKYRDHPQPPDGDGALSYTQMIYRTEWRYDGECDHDCSNGSVRSVYKLDCMKNPENSNWPDVYVDLATAQSKAFEKNPADTSSPGIYLRAIPGPTHWRNNDGSYIWRCQGFRSNAPSLEIKRNNDSWHEYHYFSNRYWDPFGRLKTPAVGGRVTDMDLLVVPWGPHNIQYRNPYNFQ